MKTEQERSAMNALESLLGDYWNIAYAEGLDQEVQGCAASETLSAIRQAVRNIVDTDRAQRQAGQEPIALIDNGTFRWHIPTPTYSVPLHLLSGQHWLYAAPQPAAQSARADFEAWFRENYHSRLDRKCANQTYNCPAAFAAWNTWEACAKVYAAAQPAVERKPLTDEQIDEIRIVQEFWQWDVGTGVFRHIARAIEAAHGITPATQRATHEK